MGGIGGFVRGLLAGFAIYWYTGRVVGGGRYWCFLGEGKRSAVDGGVLIISSSLGVYRLLGLCLRGRNCATFITGSKRTTISAFTTGGPSLILLSVVLPGVSN